ncbi:zinc finger protein [Saccharopolyspora rhizosphaerae]|uniref:zinc finger protein n=1 Tax=Saccharopolyspora rhizosphaerae TaxID=2492662 RepID=UPI001F36F65D|nr:zinc finger protein [Saccharopolyspora rhizosphaerae]
MPANGRRHASLDKRPWGNAYPSGMVVNTLCSQEVVADATREAWLWTTCDDCNAEARRVAEAVQGAPRLSV